LKTFKISLKVKCKINFLKND